MRKSTEEEGISAKTEDTILLCHNKQQDILMRIGLVLSKLQWGKCISY